MSFSLLTCAAHVNVGIEYGEETHQKSIARAGAAFHSFEAAFPNTQERIALTDQIRALTPKRRQRNTTALIRKDRDPARPNSAVSLPGLRHQSLRDRPTSRRMIIKSPNDR